jgi:hypothetical protein
MLAKISLTAAFFLMVAPPLACASFRDAARLAPTTRPSNQSPVDVVLAQDSQQNLGTSDNDNDNDNDSNDSADDDKQDSDNDQADQQNADGNVQQVPPTVFGGSDDDRGGPPQSPNVYPVDPSQ